MSRHIEPMKQTSPEDHERSLDEIELRRQLCDVTIYRTNGLDETHQVGRHILMDWILRMIGAKTLDVVNLRDGRVMLVGDTGAVDGKPENPRATALYHGVCKPETDWKICGDVAVTLDENFS